VQKEWCLKSRLGHGGWICWSHFLQIPKNSNEKS
jgi:hypothetical protein